MWSQPMPNIPETVVAMLATGQPSARSGPPPVPDFGEASVLERFGQTRPRVLFGGGWLPLRRQGHRHSGQGGHRRRSARRHEQQTVMIPLLGNPLQLGHNWQQLLASQHDTQLAFEPMAFNDPLYILLLRHHRQTQVHRARHWRHPAAAPERAPVTLRHQAGERIFYFTTCGWMMWNWLVSALASAPPWCSATMVPPSPGWHPCCGIWPGTRVTLFGTSAKYLDALHKQVTPSIPTTCLPCASSCAPDPCCRRRV